MKRPKKVVIGHLIFKIEWLDNEQWPPDSRDKAGLTIPMEERILIRLHDSEQQCSEGNLREILLHEIYHAIFHATAIGWYLTPKKGSDLEEYLCSILSSPMLSVLRQNPKVLAYLTGV